jgi:hypothetical protein
MLRIPITSLRAKGNRIALAGFSDREKATLSRLLKRILRNLEEELGDGQDVARPKDRVLKIS